MIGYIIKKFVGSKNERELKKFHVTVEKINEIEQSLQSLSDDQLRQKTVDWKARFSAISDNQELADALNEVLPEAFAVVKNACRRLLNSELTVRGHTIQWDMVPFDVQLIGGISLHRGEIAEMATGEGKTLVATLPVYLNALSGRGVHIVTVNDYLAARDSEWMGHIYRFLGLTVGCILHDQPPQARREQYHCDITYGTNAEFGFDYLRDNGMATRAEDQVQRDHYFAIVDEVDSILVDEARTPLIISGPAVVHIDNKAYDQYKASIDSLVGAQEKLCNQFLQQAEQLLKKLESDSLDQEQRANIEREIGLEIYKAKQGNPKNARLLNLLEDGANLRRMNRAEMDLLADQTKRALYATKEELYFAIDEKGHDADLTEKGRKFLAPDDPDTFMLPDITVQLHEVDSDPNLDARQRMEAKTKIQSDFEVRAQKIHVIGQLLKAYCLYEKDVQYVVQNNKVIIVDENTGRLMTGRRWSDGLHQAVEAKEGVEIERETQTFATITIQNYFRMYDKLSGMTGTAETEASEFLDIYNIGVLVIPTNRPCQRNDYHDTVYKTKREKYNAVLKEIKEIHNQGRPILVGTISVDVSEHLSKLLKRAGIVHSVLNAKYHEQEAEIITRAGQRGAVTIATNMAGRGTDIKLGSGVADVGGLHVIGTERHESRRIDRQLRGRCARQGDPGSSHFFISLEDDLMRLFGSDRISKVMERIGLEEGQELEHPLLNRSIENAQKRVEQHNFQIRKRTLEYDDVMNKQRQVVYGFRNEVLQQEDVRARLLDVMEEVVLAKVLEFTTAETVTEEWDLRGLSDWINLNFPLGFSIEELKRTADAAEHEPPAGDPEYEGMNAGQFSLFKAITQKVTEAYEVKISYENPEAVKPIERYTILSAIDKRWQEHLYHMDSLRTSISLRAYAQRDPLLEYKAEAFKMFEDLMTRIKTEICHNIFRSASSLVAFENFLRNLPKRTVHSSTSAFPTGPGGQPAGAIRGGHPSAATASVSNASSGSSLVSEANEAIAAASTKKATPVRSAAPKVGRNEPCPCGSGKKYKQCCGK